MAKEYEKDGTPGSVFLSSVYLYILSSTLVFSFLFLILGIYQLAILGLFMAGGYGASCYFAGRGRAVLAHFVALAILGAQAYVGDYSLGWGFGFHYYLLAAFALLSISTSLPTLVILSSDALVLASYFVFKALLFGSEPRFLLSQLVYNLAGDINLFAAFGAIAYSLFRYKRAYTAAERRLTAYHGAILQIANTDALTGIANRRYIRELLDLAIRDAAGSARNLAVALADLDNFKDINDQYGHECGDAVLKEVCQRFQQALRKTDALGRWGGEEFLFILRDSGLDQAREVMERLRLAVSSSPLVWKGEGIRLGVTIGVTVFGPELSLDGVVARADILLYEGKRAGKDRVVADDPQPTAL